MSTEASSTPPVRRVFTEEFKREAVRLAVERGNLSATARELGICESLLTRWRRRLQQPTNALEAARPFPGQGNARDEEVARLKRELARAQEENAILKKAVGIFTREPR
jgi:transposase